MINNTVYMIFKVKEKMGMRLDKFLALKADGFSRSKIQKMVKSGDILINGKKAKSSYLLVFGDEVYIEDVDERKDVSLKEEKLNIPVLYESKDFLVVDKPCGILVHPSGTSFKSGTIVNAVLKKAYKGALDKLRPGIVHRLDKETSGLLLVAKTKKAYESFVAQFKARTVKKYYLALVKGILKYKEGVIDSPIGRDVVNRKRMSVVAEGDGKKAVTAYKVLREFKLSKKFEVSLLLVELKTGRTHQIRVHMAAIGHPVAGDSVYGNINFNKNFSQKYGLNRQFLHAYKMKLEDPGTLDAIEFESSLPKDLAGVLDQLI